MLNRLFSSKFTSVSSAAILIGAAGLISRFLGVFRDRVLASNFGADLELDVYYAAFRVPDLVYNLIVLGALSAGFIPVFVSLIGKEDGTRYVDNSEAWNLVNNIFNVVFLLLVAVGVILSIFAPWIMPLITPGFNPEQTQTVVNMTRILFLSPLLLGLSGVLGGVLQSFRRFVSFSLAPIMYNLGIIFGAWFLADDWGVYGLAAGVVLGCLGHLLIQLPAVINQGFAWRPILDLKNSEFIKIVKLMGPRVLGLAGQQLNLIVITALASVLAAGSLAIFNLANNLQSFPIGIFGISYAIAVFPLLSKFYAKNNDKEFLRNLFHALKQILFFIIPVSALFIILRVQIVRIILGSGKFDWTDTVLTADSLGIFCFSLFAQALIPLLARAFYARQKVMAPFIAGLVSVILNIFLSWQLIRYYGVLGLAMGFSISSIVNFALLFVLLKATIREKSRDGFFPSTGGILKSLFQITFATLVMGVLTQYVKNFIGGMVDMTSFAGIFTQGALSAIFAVIVYAGILIMFHSEEMSDFSSGLKRKLLRRTKLESEGIRESGADNT